MKRLILLIAILSPLLSFAEFYKLDKVPSNIKPLGFDRGRAAALQIWGQRGCSATLISSKGHVLTALHCLEGCVSLSSSKSIKNFVYKSADRQKIASGREKCSLRFSQENKKLGSLEAYTVAAGAGYVSAVDPGNLKKELDNEKNADRRAIFSQIMQAGVGIPGDFAIIQVPKLAGRTCAKTNGRSPQIAEAIWNIGYPETKSFAVFSNGQVTRKITSPVNFQVNSGADASRLLTNRNGMFVSNIDSQPGSSGSGVQSYQGDLVGVLNAAHRDMKGDRFSSSIDYIKQYSAANFGSSVVAEAFNCL